MNSKIITILIILISILGANFFFSHLTLRLTLSGKNYSFLTRSQFQSRLQSDFPAPGSFRLLYQNQEILIDLSYLEAKINSPATINQAFSHSSIISSFFSLFSPKKASLVITFDQTRLQAFIDNLSLQIEKPFINTEIQLVTDPSSKISVVTKPGQLGLDLDPSLFDSVSQQLLRWDFTPLSLPVREIGFLPSSSDITQTESLASSLVKKTLTLKHSSGQIIIDAKTFVPWLNFKNSFDDSKIAAYVANLSQTINHDPIDALFNFADNKVIEFRPAQKGVVVNQSLLTQQIKTNLDQLLTPGALALTLDVPVTTSEPNVKNQDANSFGIKELLGSGTSTFKHSNTIRNFNVERGSSIVNHILVAPGETFSFLKNLGEVTLDSGYKKAYVIRQGKTELDVGGGICQVSTTLFRAALNAGLDITERHAHAYRVGYYEEDSPPGFDATVFIPSPDLKFINDTGNYILIQSVFDGKEKRLTYNIYGTADGRKIEISNYRKWGSAPPPPDRYIDDPSLPPGKVVQEEHRIPGLNTAFDWKVTKGDQIIHQKTFTSNFVPWGAVYRRGVSP